jgi:Secretion system C-terminal sorting domain
MKKLILITFALTGGLLLNAQPTLSVLNATGQTLRSATFQLTYSVGEPMITVLKNPNDILTQGFIQPETAKKGNEFNFYPNPVADKLYFENAERVASYKIYDMAGREVFGQDFDKPQRVVTVNLEMLAEAIYIVNAFDVEGKRLHSFQIMKK